jgi:hypothetical protein
MILRLAAAASLTFLLTVGAAHARTDRLNQFEELSNPSSLQSANGFALLILNCMSFPANPTGCRLRLYLDHNSDSAFSESELEWFTFPQGGSAYYASMQGDGNFVLLDSDHSTPVWDTGTQGNSGAYLLVQNDGNVVIYSSSDVPLWSTGTGEGPGPKPMARLVPEVKRYGDTGGVPTLDHDFRAAELPILKPVANGRRTGLFEPQKRVVHLV